MGKIILKRNYDYSLNLISKECSCCHKIKSVSEFGKDKNKKIDGLQLLCKECNSKRRPKKRKPITRNYDNEGNLISKECSHCHEIKLISKFHKSTNTKDGLRSECKECSKKYMQENKGKVNERQRKKYSKKTQEALQQIEIEVKSNPQKYNCIDGKKPYGIIYLVHNIRSDKYYVGQTTRGFDNRYPLGWLHAHGHKNTVKHDLELYGENSFECIKTIDVAYSQYELDKKEVKWIDYYNSYENGYNERRGNIFTNRGKEK